MAQCLEWIGKQGQRRFRAHAAQQPKIKSKQPVLREMNSVALLRAALPEAPPVEPQVTARSAADGVSSVTPALAASPSWPADTAASEGPSADAAGPGGKQPVAQGVSERRPDAADVGLTDAEESGAMVRPKKALPQDALPPAPLQADTTLAPRPDTRQRSARAGADAGGLAAAESTLGVALLSKPVKLAFRGAAVAAAAAAGLLEEAGQLSRGARGVDAAAGEASAAEPWSARGVSALPAGAAAEGAAGGGDGPPLEAPKAAPKVVAEAPKVSRRLMERGARRIRGDLLPSEEPVRVRAAALLPGSVLRPSDGMPSVCGEPECGE